MNFPLRIPFWLPILLKDVVWFGDRKLKKVYLTFDDGPIPDVTEDLLDCLRKHNVKATFFCVGHNLEKHPEIYHSIIKNGHQLGNHTYNHLDAWNTPKGGYLDNVMACQKVFEEKGLHTKLFRPPYGKLTWKLKNELKKKGFKTVMWSLLSADFKKGMTFQKCAENVINNVKHGDIIVFHDNHKTAHVTCKALDIIIKKLKKEGFEFGLL